MGSDSTEVACKISMLWNWYTIDSCFLSSTWHNRTKGQFAGTVIGVFFWVMDIEDVRRLGREYDRRLLAAHSAVRAQAKCGCGSDSKHASDIDNSTEAGGFVAMKCRPTIPKLPTWSQQIVRGALYGTQYTNAFLMWIRWLHRLWCRHRHCPRELTCKERVAMLLLSERAKQANPHPKRRDG